MDDILEKCNKIKTPIENLRSRIGKRIRQIENSKITKNTIIDILCMQRELCSIIEKMQKKDKIG